MASDEEKLGFEREAERSLAKRNEIATAHYTLWVKLARSRRGALSTPYMIVRRVTIATWMERQYLIIGRVSPWLCRRNTRPRRSRPHTPLSNLLRLDRASSRPRR